MIAATCIETVNAAATVVLVIITAIYICHTRRLVGHAADQANKMKDQVDEMKEQNALLKKRDTDRGRQAIAAIVEELLANDDTPDPNVRRYFLEAAYNQGLWALAEIELGDATREKITLAYKLIRTTNAMALSFGIEKGLSMRTGKAACEAIHDAITAMRADDAFAEFHARMGAHLYDSR